MGEGTVRESGMDMDTLLYLTWRTSKDLLDSTGNSAQYFVMTYLAKESEIGPRICMGFPGGSVVKNLPANAGDIKTRVSSLGREDPVEEGMAAHSSILAWRIPWTEEPGGLQSMGSQRVGGMTERLTLFHFFLKQDRREPQGFRRAKTQVSYPPGK